MTVFYLQLLNNACSETVYLELCFWTDVESPTSSNLQLLLP